MAKKNKQKHKAKFPDVVPYEKKPKKEKKQGLYQSMCDPSMPLAMFDGDDDKPAPIYGRIEPEIEQ